MARMTSLVLLAALLCACPGGAAQQCETKTAADAPAQATPAAGATQAAVPAFPLEALRGPHALRAKLYVKPDGVIRKYAVYVAKEAIPAWVHELADKELGKGEDTEYEVEQYENGDTVYEVTRKIGGKAVELAVHSKERRKLYIERKGLAMSDAPDAVTRAAGEIKGLKIEELEIKEYPDRKLYEVKGKLDGKEHSVYFAADGKVLRRSTALEAKVKIDL